MTRRSFIGCMRDIEVFSRGTTKINLEDEQSLYIGMYRGCRLQVPCTVSITLCHNYKVMDACCCTAYITQTCDQQCYTISEVAAD